MMGSKYIRTDLFMNKIAGSAFFSAAEKGKIRAAIEKEPGEDVTAQPDIEKICTRIKAEAIKRNVEYMKHGDRYMLGFVDGMRLARRIVDGTIDDPVYFTLSGEKKDG